MRHLIVALIHRDQYEWWALRPFRRHSLVLVVAGIVYAAIGASYIAGPTNPTRDAALRVPLTWAPLEFWGGVFILVGSLAVLSSRWPPASETWGYTALSGLAALWASFYTWGVVLGAGAAATAGIGVWALVAFLWWAIAGLINPHELPAFDGRPIDRRS